MSCLQLDIVPRSVRINSSLTVIPFIVNVNVSICPRGTLRCSRLLSSQGDFEANRSLSVPPHLGEKLCWDSTSVLLGCGWEGDLQLILGLP